MPEYYAVKVTGGKRVYYRTKADYEAGRGQARATAAAQRSRIRKKLARV